MSMQNAVNLKNEIETMKSNWDETAQFTIRNTDNLSSSDLDTINMYCDTYIQNGGTGFNGLMDPMGEIKSVLDSYNIKSMFASPF